jgi:DNA polymerase-3 subunit beta
MKFTIDRGSLTKTLGHVSKIAPRNVTIPILSNVLISTDGDAIEIKGTDLDREVRAKCAADVDTAGAVTVSGGTLADIVGKMPEGARVVVETTIAGRCIVKAGRSRFTLPTLPVEDFPDIADGAFDATFTLPSADILAQFAATQFASATDETRYYLNGIYWHVAGGDLVAVATDGHRLARMALACPDGTEVMPGVIVPREAVTEIMRLAKGATGDVTIDVSAQKIRFTVGGVVLTSKLIDGTFPDYTRVIPVANKTIARIDRESFFKSVDRVAAIGSESGHGVKLAFGHGVVVLSMRDTDNGEAIDEIEAEYSGEAMEIGFNSRYLSEILGQIKSDRCAVRLADPGSPTLFLPDGGDNPTIVLMPMRV